MCFHQDPEGKPKKANIRDNRDGTYTVSYVPDMTGRYTITIKYGGDEIPFSPYRIHALPTGDASKCLVTGKHLIKSENLAFLWLHYGLIIKYLKYSCLAYIICCNFVYYNVCLQFPLEDTALVSKSVFYISILCAMVNRFWTQNHPCIIKSYCKIYPNQALDSDPPFKLARRLSSLWMQRLLGKEKSHAKCPPLMGLNQMLMWLRTQMERSISITQLQSLGNT